MSLHRVGDREIEGVRQTTRTYEGDGLRITFYIDDGFPVPAFEPGVCEIVADGQRYGLKDVCCTGRSETQGTQYASVKWRCA